MDFQEYGPYKSNCANDQGKIGASDNERINWNGQLQQALLQQQATNFLQLIAIAQAPHLLLSYGQQQCMKNIADASKTSGQQISKQGEGTITKKSNQGSLLSSSTSPGPFVSPEFLSQSMHGSKAVVDPEDKRPASHFESNSHQREIAKISELIDVRWLGSHPATKEETKNNLLEGVSPVSVMPMFCLKSNTIFDQKSAQTSSTEKTKVDSSDEAENEAYESESHNSTRKGSLEIGCDRSQELDLSDTSREAGIEEEKVIKFSQFCSIARASSLFYFTPRSHSSMYILCGADDRGCARSS